MKEIVIIGAGYAGVLCAKKLEKKLRRKRALDEVRITIIDKHPYHTMLTELHEVAACRVEEESIKLSLAKIFAGRRVRVAVDTVTGIQFDEQRISGENGAYTYDYLVLAAGSAPTFWNVEGAGEYSYTLWSYEDAVKLKERIHACFRQAAQETQEQKRRELLSFYVVGAGFTGVEMAGELAEYVPVLCEKFQVRREEVTIADVDSMARPVPMLPEKLSDKVTRRLRKQGVEVRMNASVVGIGENYIRLSQENIVTQYVAGTVIWTAGVESAPVTSKAAGQLKSAGRGRILVDAYLRSVDYENLYVAGDNMMYTPPGEKQPVPQMVENAEHSAKTVAHNIVVALSREAAGNSKKAFGASGTGNAKKASGASAALMKEYRPRFHGVMVSIGGRYGVARGGLAKHQINLASFFAMFAKHFINVVYFIQVMGWTKVLSYLKHEFFTIRNRRSFLGGHFSNRTPSFLLVPLRIWLGVVWVFEGVMKIVEGWFQKPMLEDFFGGANAWYDSILGKVSTAGTAVSHAASGVITNVSQVADVVSNAAQTADAVAGATGTASAAAETGTVLMNWNFGLFRTILVSGKDLAASTLGDYAFKVDIPFVNWFVEKVVLSTDGMQMFMQIVIVILEIAIGLGLVAGLFTFPSAAVSLVLQAMFLSTTGLYLNGFWMVFAAVAVLIGGGYTLGLDYYVGPFLKRHWKNVKWVKRWYLYND